MSEENVEIVRRFYESLNKWLASYWFDPEQPLEQSPELEEVFDQLDPEAEWDWLFSPETFRGREQLLQAVADYLETVSDWRVEIEELIDGGEDRVLSIGRVVARGKGSGTPVLQPIFAVITVRSGKVARIEDHTERADALEAAGLRE
jgi:ketosteroid isomerase-like protein